MAVIGAGIVGLAAAYEASRLGYQVTIVDAAYQGRATDAGAGIVNPLDLTGEESAAEQQRVALSGPRHYRDLLAQLADDGETDHGFARVGQVVVAANEAEEVTLGQLSARLSNAAPASLADYMGPVRRLTPTEATRMVPYLADGVGGLLLPGIARVDGRRLSASLARALLKRGAWWRNGVGHVVTEDDRVVGVEVDGRRIDTDRVIAAPGSWAAATWPHVLAESVKPIRGQIVHLRHVRNGISTPIVSSVSGPYIVAFDLDRIVTGATHEDVGFAYQATASGLADVLSTAVRIAPGLADATLVETRIGFRPVSRDRLPIIGPVQEVKGAVIATGLGAHGLTLGPAIGVIAARMAVGQDPRHDVTALRPDRFVVGP